MSCSRSKGWATYLKFTYWVNINHRISVHEIYILCHTSVNQIILSNLHEYIILKTKLPFFSEKKQTYILHFMPEIRKLPSLHAFKMPFYVTSLSKFSNKVENQIRSLYYRTKSLRKLDYLLLDIFFCSKWFLSWILEKVFLHLTDLFFYEKTLLQTSFDKWIQLKVIFKWKVITLNYKLFNYILNSSNFSWKVLKGCSNTSKLSTYVFLLIFQ